MKLQEYNEVLSSLRGFKKRVKMRQLNQIFPQWNVKTIGSIYSQEYQRKMKKTRYKFHNSEVINKIYNRMRSEMKSGHAGCLIRIADEYDVSPALIARAMLEKHLQLTTPHESDDKPTSISRTTLTQMMRDTTRIPEPVLAYEIQLCVLDDDMYGPMADTIKHSIGHEYEVLLEQKLKKNQIAYLGEDILRSKGYDKTPDFKLEVPIAVNGHVVNWIESKASFGDPENHETYLKEQFWSYWNRFGPGLVIYWFGFIDELDTHRQKGIMLMDHFPTEIVTMKPALVHNSEPSVAQMSST